MTETTNSKQPIDPREMQEQRAQLIDDARALLDGNKPSMRDITSARQKTSEAEKLNLEIAKAELHNDELRDEYAAKMGGSSRGGTGPMFRNLDTGAEIRAVRHGESFRTAGDVESRVDPFRLIAGYLTGNWKGRDEERSYAQGALTGGGVMLSSGVSSKLINPARAKSIVSRAGTYFLPMESETMRLVRIESDPTASFVPEGQEISESTGTFGAVELRSRGLCVYSEISIEFLRNAANAEDVIRNMMTKAIGTGLDAAFLNGQGAGEEPVGLLYSDQVTESAVGGAFTYDALINAMGLCWDNNVEADAWLMAPSLRKFVAKMKDGEALPYPAPPEVAALKKYTSSQLTSADSNGVCYVGTLENTVIGIRSEIEIEMSNVAGDVFKKKMAAIRAMMFVDFAVCRSGDIVKLTGITGL